MQENSKHDVLGDVVPALTLPTWFEYSRVMEAGLFVPLQHSSFASS